MEGQVEFMRSYGSMSNVRNVAIFITLMAILVATVLMLPQLDVSPGIVLISFLIVILLMIAVAYLDERVRRFREYWPIEDGGESGEGEPLLAERCNKLAGA